MFIDRINDRLKAKNMKGADLCRKLGIPTSNYTQWKEYIPRGSLLKKIADELDTSVDWLLERETVHEPAEQKLLNDYRMSDAHGKAAISSIADIEARRCRAVASVSITNDGDLKSF